MWSPTSAASLGQTWTAALSSWRTISAAAEGADLAPSDPLAPPGEQMAPSVPVAGRWVEDPLAVRLLPAPGKKVGELTEFMSSGPIFPMVLEKENAIADLRTLMGATNPTYFALYARRRMDRFGATEEDFAQVKVKNARHGLANPYARYRGEVTVEEVLSSPMVADPLRLL